MQDKVKPPAICLAIVGGIGALLALYGLVSQVSGFGTGDPEMLRKLGAPERVVELLASSGFVAILFSIIQLGVALFVVTGAARMLKLRSWSLAFAASIVAMFPCISPCCILGVPAGVWCIYVLMKPEIKEAFGS